MNNIIIPNPERVETIKKKIKHGGDDRIHILSDFDRTLTRFCLNGEKVFSLISILAKGNFLGREYSQQAQALFDKYHPIETDPTIPLVKKKAKMREWWLIHFQLLIKSGLTKKEIRKVVQSGRIKLRDNFDHFINFLKGKKIPLLILSSSGLGKEAIETFFKEESSFFDNIYVISNNYLWDEEERAIGIKEPIIHTMNKEAIAAKDFPFFGKIRERENVILMGDSPTDVDMITGFDYDNLLKIGFLNEREEEQMEIFQKSYDIILIGDPSLEYVNRLLEEIV